MDDGLEHTEPADKENLPQMHLSSNGVDGRHDNGTASPLTIQVRTV